MVLTTLVSVGFLTFCSPHIVFYSFYLNYLPPKPCFVFLSYLKRASLVVEMVKNLPAMGETQVQSLGWEDPQRREWQLTPVFFFFAFLREWFFFSFIFISWRLITLQYCSRFCHTLTWISHGFTCIPHPGPPSHLPFYPIPLGLPSVPGPSTCLMHPTWTGDLCHHR